MRAAHLLPVAVHQGDPGTAVAGIAALRLAEGSGRRSGRGPGPNRPPPEWWPAALAGLVDEQRVHAALELPAGPDPRRSGPYVQVAVPQAGLQSPVLQAGRSRMQVGGVLAGALADARAGHAQLIGACDDLAEQVVDDGVRGAGDADRVPPAPVKVSRRA